MTSVLSSRENLTPSGQVGRIGPNRLNFIRFDTFFGQIGKYKSLNSKITLVLGSSELHTMFTAKKWTLVTTFSCLKRVFSTIFWKKCPLAPYFQNWLLAFQDPTLLWLLSKFEVNRINGAWDIRSSSSRVGWYIPCLKRTFFEFLGGKISGAG